MEELKELELLDEGEMVDIPELELEDLIEENRLSVIVRCLNPHAHKVGGLIKALPPIWGLEDRTQGRIVGEDKVQFSFRSDTDLQYVLNKGPWFVNGWIVVLDQWSPNPSEDYLKKITFWVRVRGLPIQMLKKEVIDTLLGPLGEVDKVELHAKNSNSIEYVRAMITVNSDEPLQFRRIARLKSGATYPTELEYEKLLKEKESLAKERLSKGPSKEGGSRSSQPARSTQASLSRRSGKEKEQLQEEKRRGKRVSSTPQLVWQPIKGKGGTEKTRSTEESIANTRSSGGTSGNKSATERLGRKEQGVEPAEADSVFNRLGGFEKEWGSKGSRGSRADNTSSQDLRLKLSGTSSGERHDEPWKTHSPQREGDRTAVVRDNLRRLGRLQQKRIRWVHRFFNDWG
ncbi:Uncharacterized protein Rs2_22694 [Raphanus sativus]|nr:Uncharacterized protein Rs2_22694 [Raphanus sativus]